MNRIIFIVPFFGKMKNYFQLWLNSCAYNTDVDWLIFTDDATPYRYPQNVRVIYKSFSWIQQRIKSKFDFDVSIERPYKLCDYRPAYGYIFGDFIEGYSMWGYCDTDLIWGRIRKFVTDEMIDHYDKIGIFGHCTLCKNSEEINTLFMKNLDGVKRYQTVFAEGQGHSFDEEYEQSINNIFENYGYKVFDRLKIANIYTKSSHFKLTAMKDRSGYQVERRKKAFFLWDRGRLLRYIHEEGELVCEEFLYIHMQSRCMKDRTMCVEPERFKIIPNAFENLEVDQVTEENFHAICLEHPNLHYFRLRSKNLYLKIRKKIGKGI